ncbi:MAG: hypothetical protein ACOYBW_10835 [Fluviibacter phosphoraccumulans]
MSNFKKIKKSFFENANLDSHVLLTLMFRIWMIVAGGATIFFIPYGLNGTEQGYYYTFSSILAIQVFFELGLGQAIVQIVAHESVAINNEDYLLQEEARARLGDFQKQIRKWFLLASLVFFALGCSIGVVILQRGGLDWGEWLCQWVVLMGATSVVLFYSCRLSMIEGLSFVDEVAKLRLQQSVFGYLTLWLALIAGAKLWAATAIPIIGVIYTKLWLKKNRISRSLEKKCLIIPNNPIKWMVDIFPFQWRMALSFICSYFTLNLFTPLAFYYSDAVTAGQLGLTLAVFNAISTLGMSWMSAKSAKFSTLFALKQGSELIVLFRSSILYAVGATTVISIMVILTVIACRYFEMGFIARMSSTPIVIMLGVVSIVNCLTFSCAVFMRASKREPTLLVSLVGAIFISLGSYYAIHHGAEEMVAIYLIISLLVSLPLTIVVLNKYCSFFGFHIKLRHMNI